MLKTKRTNLISDQNTNSKLIIKMDDNHSRMSNFQLDQRANFLALILLDALEDGNESSSYILSKWEFIFYNGKGQELLSFPKDDYMEMLQKGQIAPKESELWRTSRRKLLMLFSSTTFDHIPCNKPRNPAYRAYNKLQRINVHLNAFSSVQKGTEPFFPPDIRAILARHNIDASYLLSERGISPLHYSCQMEDAKLALEITRRFLDDGADANVLSNENKTPLHVAAIFGRVDIVNILLEHGARHDLIDIERKTPMHYAIEECHFEVLEAIRNRIFQNKDNRVLSENQQNKTNNRVHYNYDVTSPYYINITHRRHRPQPIFPAVGSPLNTPNKTCAHQNAITFPREFYGSDLQNLNNTVPTNVTIPLDYETDELRAELINYGYPPGPITKTTKQLYINRLIKYRRDAPDPLAMDSKRKNNTAVGSPLNTPNKTCAHQNAITFPTEFYGSDLQNLNNTVPTNVTIPLDYETDELRAELINYGYPPGPITKTTKQLYINRLIKYRRDAPDPLAMDSKRKNNTAVGSPLNTPNKTCAHENTITFPRQFYGSDLQNLNNTVSTNVTIPLDYETDKLRAELINYGDPPGPITKTTKQLYINRLIKYRRDAPDPLAMDDKRKNNTAENARFSVELLCTIRSPEHYTKISDYLKLELKSTEYFANHQNKHKMREGHLKQSFIYMLIDPRISCNLPGESVYLENTNVWDRFLHSVFYVGKGKTSRPYSHLYEAMKLHSRLHSNQNDSNSANKTLDVQRGKVSSIRKRGLHANISKKNIKKSVHNKKVERILDIWHSGKGVVCLHVFHNILPTEAYTREAAIIDAFGLQHLTNVKRGHYYGPAETWTMKEKKYLGIALLHKAMQIYLVEGESQLSPSDLPKIAGGQKGGK